MKIQAIPAQITTVEDKIVGNLNLTQMLLLMIPVFWGMLVYTMFPPVMDFSWYKLPLFLFVAMISLSLALRIKDKILLQWIVMLLRYNARPKYYVFTKNDAYLRSMDMVTFAKPKRKLTRPQAKYMKETTHTQTSLGDIIRLEQLLTNPNYSFSIKAQKKGALYVAIEEKHA